VAEPLEIQIANRVSRCGEGRCSLEDFREWFVPISIDIESAGNEDAIALAHEIDGILAESSSAGWTEADIVEELARVVSPFVPDHSRKSLR
jgi:hypothetical protein